MSNTHQSIEQAADAIAVLINHNPRSPRREEIETIIRNVAAPMEALSPQHLAYRALRAEVDHYDHKASQGDEPDDDAPLMALLERVSDAEKAIWATPATTLADMATLKLRNRLPG